MNRHRRAPVAPGRSNSPRGQRGGIGDDQNGVKDNERYEQLEGEEGGEAQGEREHARGYHDQGD